MRNRNNSKWLDLNAPFLIIGPAHSGKSQFLSEFFQRDQPAIVLGTGDLEDPFTKMQVEELKKNRPPLWESLDVGGQLPEAFAAHIKQTSQLMVDSLNLYIAHQLILSGERYSDEQLWDHLKSELKTMISTIGLHPQTRVGFTATEVGAGVSPKAKLARQFRELCGKAHIEVAKSCASVIHLTAGIPLLIKG